MNYEFKAYSYYRGDKNIASYANGIIQSTEGESYDDIKWWAQNTVDTDDSDYGISICETDKKIEIGNDEYYNPNSRWYKKRHLQFYNLTL